MVLVPPHKDLEKRRPVWEAVSGLYLDTELLPEDRYYIAEVLTASSYSILDLSQILRSEVHPVLYANLRAVAGVWGAFDQQLLERKILENLHRKQSWWRRWFGAPSFGLGLVDEPWREIIGMIHGLRTAGRTQRTDSDLDITIDTGVLTGRVSG